MHNMYRHHQRRRHLWAAASQKKKKKKQARRAPLVESSYTTACLYIVYVRCTSVRTTSSEKNHRHNNHHQKEREGYHRTIKSATKNIRSNKIPGTNEYGSHLLLYRILYTYICPRVTFFFRRTTYVRTVFPLFVSYENIPLCLLLYC